MPESPWLERTSQIQLRGIDVSAIGSNWLKKHGVNLPARTAARVQYQWGNQTANYNLLYTWASQTGRVWDYIQELCDKSGLHMVNALSATAKYGWDTLPEKWHVNPDAVSFIKDGEPDSDPRPDGFSTVWNLGEMLYNSATENGAEFVFNTHAEQLVGDAASGISGVIATAEDGSFVQYNAAKGVVLATGDIGGNQEMIDAFAPICNRADGNMYTPAGGNTGDAILMGSWAGAAISKSPASPMVHQFTPWSVTFNLSAFIMCWPAVNLKGERYGAEMPFEPFLNNARMNTPGNKAWSIFDADYAQYVMAQWPNHYQKWLDGIEDEIETRIANGELVARRHPRGPGRPAGHPGRHLHQGHRALQHHVHHRRRPRLRRAQELPLAGQDRPVLRLPAGVLGAHDSVWLACERRLPGLHRRGRAHRRLVRRR